jgi:hypothetical protein
LVGDPCDAQCVHETDVLVPRCHHSLIPGEAIRLSGGEAAEIARELLIATLKAENDAEEEMAESGAAAFRDRVPPLVLTRVVLPWFLASELHEAGASFISRGVTNEAEQERVVLR